MRKGIGFWFVRLFTLFICSIYSLGIAHSQNSTQETQAFPQSSGISKTMMERLLQQVEDQAKQHKLIGWPELPSGFVVPKGFDPKDLLSQRIWAQSNKVIWHYQEPSQTWDAVLVLQRTDNPLYPDERFGTVVFIKNAFGNPKVTPITRLPYIGLSISTVDEIPNKPQYRVPKWVGTGPIWHFLQESDGDMPPARCIFHAEAGFGWEMNRIETKHEHAKLVERDNDQLDSLKAKGIVLDDDPYAYSPHECSSFFAEDLCRAENVRSFAEFVWFHFPTGLEISDFVVPLIEWNQLRNKVHGVPIPRAVSTSTGRLTPRSTRTPPALPSALSQHLASSAPLSATVQPGPVSFFR